MSDLFGRDGDYAQSFTQPFLVRITGKALATGTSEFAGQWLYSYIEQSFNPDTGIPVDANPARVGSYDPATDTAIAPLLESDNRSIPVGTLQWITLNGIVNGNTFYQMAVSNHVDIIRITGAPTVTTSGLTLNHADLLGWDPVAGEFTIVRNCYYLELGDTLPDVGDIIQAMLISGSASGIVTNWPIPIYSANSTGSSGSNTNAWNPVQVSALPGTDGSLQPIDIYAKNDETTVIGTGYLWLYPDQDPVRVGTWLSALDTNAVHTDGKPVYRKNWPSGGDDNPTDITNPTEDPPNPNTPFNCDILELLQTACIFANSSKGVGACSTVPAQQLTLKYDGGSGKWVSNKNFDYAGGSGLMKFWADNLPHLSIDDIELSYCDGVFKGTPALGLCPQSGDKICGPNNFTVSLSCECCSIDGWDGPGWYCVQDGTHTVVVELLEADRCNHELVVVSGPYDTEDDAHFACDPPSTTCCPGLLLKKRVFITFESCTGPLACLNGQNYSMVWDVVLNRWIQHHTINGHDVTFQMTCQAPDFFFPDGAFLFDASSNDGGLSSVAGNMTPCSSVLGTLFSGSYLFSSTWCGIGSGNYSWRISE